MTIEGWKRPEKKRNREVAMSSGVTPSHGMATATSPREEMEMTADSKAGVWTAICRPAASAGCAER